MPVYILLLDFPVKHAIPLASATVFGGAIANNILNAPKRHPDHPHRPVSDWDLILQLEPMTILGALVGAVLNDLLPDIVLVTLMVLLLTVTAQKTLSKASKLYAKESEQLKALNANEVTPLIGGDPVEQNSSTFARSNTNGSSSSLESGERSKLRDIANMDVDTSSWREDCNREATINAIMLSVLFVIVTVLNLLKGGTEEGGGPMGLAVCGSTCFWVSQTSIIAVIVAFAFMVRRRILRRVKTKDSPVLSDIEWDDNNTVLYPLYAIVAGLVAGLFGVGGGIIKGPLMLALGE